MNSFVSKVGKVCCCKRDSESSGDEFFVEDAVNLSHVGDAVHAVLASKHARQRHNMWNVTSGRIIGSVHDTPRGLWDTAADPPEGHDDWFPEKMASIICRTEAWCDIMYMAPPDGKFLDAFRAALLQLAVRSRTSPAPIVVRIMFGHIPGLPVVCGRVLKGLTRDLPADAQLHIWVGAWRKGLSWNHAKILAVDGRYLHTGGHNLWDAHYLAKDPVHDLSFELAGNVALDGHRFANQQWAFIERKQRTCVGRLVDRHPDTVEVFLRTRVSVSEWPKGAVPEFPPRFVKSCATNVSHRRGSAMDAADVPLIAIGRQGHLIWSSRKRPSDDAILAMINSSKKTLRLVIQDLGPVCFPGTKQALPSLSWPKAYMTAIGEAIYERGVEVMMVLSNPNSVPGGLKGLVNYGNGWTCVDVAAEIIKRLQKQHADIDDARLRAIIAEKLKICYVRHRKSSSYEDGMTIGLHSKHFIVDDTCCYIGSQNLYLCDLADWGIVVDSEAEVQKIMNDYFVPLWASSYLGIDVDVQQVMDGLNVDRNGKSTYFYDYQNQMQASQVVLAPETDAEYHRLTEEYCPFGMKSPM